MKSMNKAYSVEFGEQYLQEKYQCISFRKEKVTDRGKEIEKLLPTREAH